MSVDSLALPAAADTFQDRRRNAYGMDPAAFVDFWFDFSRHLVGAERLHPAVSVTPLAAAAALGLLIAPDPAPSIVDKRRGVRFWASIAEAFQTNPAYSGGGAKLGVQARVTTTAGRIIQATGCILVLAR